MFTSSPAVFFSPQVTKGMFGARKKFVEFVEVVDNDFTDESMYYNQPSMFPHRSDKDVSLFPHTCTPAGHGFLLSEPGLASNVFL